MWCAGPRLAPAVRQKTSLSRARKSSWNRATPSIYEEDIVHTARGAGDEAAVVLGTLVLTTGEPVLMPVNMDMSATPTS